ncbi:hypothetical protein BKA59DRAFT_497654 [Fusarium tricinctum]|uniref:Protein kinase domain-containing protein n=1 Tax=Fusarium tricinctum TaxID=61284 RepID=A0A8K0W6K0_9HYPO|nr:hypothetical protein BKA59DRAFT_497654 [Fusarium tricinctum]
MRPPLLLNVSNLTLSSSVNPKNEHGPAPAQVHARISNKASDKLPITYKLMTLINEAKFNGSIITTWFGHHDFAARPSRQIARGGYFQTRLADYLGAAKYPLLATESKELSERSYKALAEELRVLSHPFLMNHENIINIKTIGWTRLDASSAAWMPMIVLDLADLGTLTEYLSKERLGIDSKLQIARDVGCGLQALHSCGITHGDLKFDNVLMFRGKDGKVQAKLCDFGCSYITTGDENRKDKVEINAGTKPWNSPELYKQVPYSWLPHIDTYSFGLLVWRVLLNGRNPFQGLEEEDIDRRKAQDLIVSDASLSVEDEYDRSMVLRGAVSSTDRAHLYMRGIAMPKRCFRYTLSSIMSKRDLTAAMDSLASERIYGFVRLFDIPWTAQEMFLQSIIQVAENSTLSEQIRADAYIQLCYAYIDGFGTTSDFAEAMRCLKEARDRGSSVAASIFRPLMLATGHILDESLKRGLKPWLFKAVENGSLLGRRELLFLEGNPVTVRKAEEQERLLMGARMLTDKGVADAEHIEMMFLPANLEVLQMLLGAGQVPIDGDSQLVLSRSMNTYIHAGAAWGIDPDHFHNAMSDNAGNTALLLALRFGNVENAQALLDHGASASLANKRGETPWHWLISLEEGHIKNIAASMLAYVDGLKTFALARDSESNQFYMHKPFMVKILLDCGADPVLEHQGKSPIDLAIQLNHAEILKTLIECAVRQGIDALPLRSLNDVINMQGADRINPISEGQEHGDTLILQAAGVHTLHERLVYCKENWIDSIISTLEALQEYGHIPAWSENNNKSRLETFRLLCSATTSGPEIMGRILKATSIFPNPNGTYKTPDEEAAAIFWKAALRDILATSQPDMYSPSSHLDDADELIHSYCASLHGDISVLQSILDDCTDVNCTDRLGRTPLMTARGADVDLTWYVVNNTDIDVVPLKYLLEPMHPFLAKTPPISLGPDTKDTFSLKDVIDQPGEGGMTALHHAAGADVNARSGSKGLINQERLRPLDLCFWNATQSRETLVGTYGLERTTEDVLLGRFHIANFLVRLHRSLALRLSLLAAQEGMTKLLAVVLRVVKTEMNANPHGHVDYTLLLNNYPSPH